VPGLLTAVTLDEANAAARKYLSVDRASVVIADPAQHEREQTRDGRNLTDPEQKRPPQHLDSQIGEAFLHLEAQRAHFQGEPMFEAVCGSVQHVFAPVALE